MVGLMATREQRCRFDHEEEGAPVCGECRRCCDALKALLEVLETDVDRMRGKFAEIAQLTDQSGKGGSCNG